MELPAFAWSRRGVAALLGASLLLAQGCFYDHRVTQAIQARRQRAREAEGQKLGGESSGATLPAKNVGRVRFYVADAYRRAHPGWQRQLEDLVERTGAVLRPAFGVGLEVSELHAWTPSCEPKDLEACLDELSAFDVEGHAEWVVGVLPAEPRLVTNLDDLGMAHVPGRHMVLRDVSDIAEREAIGRAFPTHTEARRDEIYKRRREHKRLAVFLHEWAHTLGGLHQEGRESILHASYDDGMTDFDAANAALLSASLEDAFGEGGHAALRKAADASSEDSFESGALTRLIAQLDRPEPEEPARGAPPGEVRHPFVIEGDEAALLADLPEPERAIYRESVRVLKAGDAARSLEVLAPLVARFPANYAVQHLACGLSMQFGHGKDIQLVCSRAQGLARTQSSVPPG